MAMLVITRGYVWISVKSKAFWTPWHSVEIGTRYSSFQILSSLNGLFLVLRFAARWSLVVSFLGPQFFGPLFSFQFLLMFNCQVFAPVCFLDCMDLMFVYAQHVFLVYACKVLFVMVHVCLMLWSLLFFLFFPSRMQKRECFAMGSPSWMTILREDSSGNIDNLVGLPSGYLT